MMTLTARGRTLEFPRRPLVMGILNLGADSFSGDGIPNLDRALARAAEMLAEGAEIVDIGAESARTNRAAISEDEEAVMLRAFIARWPEVIGGRVESERPWLSINTWRPNVAAAALELGGEILNDIGGLPTAENAHICAATGAALLIMHSVGEPKIPHTEMRYDDVLERLEQFFVEKIALAESAGLARESIVLDPGIDFAKQRADNLRIYAELARLQRFERPILLPVSRKTVIGEVLALPEPRDRDAGTMACIVSGMLRGANIFRVHEVRAAAQTVRAIEAAEKAA